MFKSNRILIINTKQLWKIEYKLAVKIINENSQNVFLMKTFLNTNERYKLISFKIQIKQSRIQI